MLRTRRKLLGTAGCIVSLVIAVIYLVVIPNESARAEGPLRIVLLYGHSFCWALLAAASLLWAMKTSDKWVSFFAYAGLGAYVAFMSTLLITKYL